MTWLLLEKYSVPLNLRNTTLILTRKEIFGPVMSIMRYSDEDEAIRRANDSCYGLAASVFSNR